MSLGRNTSNTLYNPNRTYKQDVCNTNNVNSLENVGYTSYMVFVLFTSLLGNSTVIIVILKSPLRIKNAFHLIVSLACSDLILSAFLIPFKISEKLSMNRFCFGLPICYLYIMTDGIGNVASILSLLFISVDRFIAIKYPMHYERILTKRRVRVGICFVWFFAAVWTIAGSFKWQFDKSSGAISSVSVQRLCTNSNYYFYVASFAGIYLPALVFMTAAYIVVLTIAITQIRAIAKTAVVVQSEDNYMHNLHQKKAGTLKKEIKATKSVGIVYITFVLCWLPGFIINVIILIDTNVFPRLLQKYPELFLAVFYLFIHILPATNGMLNPLIYCFSNIQFRNALKKVSYELCGMSQQYNNEYTTSFHLSPRSSARNSPNTSRMTSASNSRI